MMEKFTARSFCEFSIFTFLSFAKVLSISSEPLSENIIHVMQNDQELCSLPPSVYENDIIKNCSYLKYPDKDKISTYNTPNIFLCLAFYDTWYKFCTYNSLNQIPYDNFKFEPKIHEFFPGKDEQHITMFCENIKNISFSYKKLKPLLSLVHFNKPTVCYTTCFDMTEKFNPLCAVLAWSKSIDENMKNISKTEHTQVQSSTVNVKIQQSSTLNSGISKTTSVAIKSNVQQSALSNSVQTSSQTNVKDGSSTKFEPVDNNKQILSKNSDKPSENTIVKDINNSEEGKKDIDIKTSTISENTQDHENSVNQEDLIHIEDKKSPYDLNDGLDNRPIDIADHSRNIPEPSEQRDIISNYHNIRSDEESHFFTYLTIISLIFITAYIGYHNKQKILAIVLEGRRSRNNRGRRRPSTANYRKLDCTLEEAVTSQCNANVTHVIY